MNLWSTSLKNPFERGLLAWQERFGRECFRVLLRWSIAGRALAWLEGNDLGAPVGKLVRDGGFAAGYSPILRIPHIPAEWRLAIPSRRALGGSRRFIG